MRLLFLGGSWICGLHGWFSSSKVGVLCQGLELRGWGKGGKKVRHVSIIIMVLLAPSLGIAIDRESLIRMYRGEASELVG